MLSSLALQQRSRSKVESYLYRAPCQAIKAIFSGKANQLHTLKI
jgi:hypothetical protein